MNARIFVVEITLSLSLAVAGPSFALPLPDVPIAIRWNAPSTLTAEQVVDVLYREQKGETVPDAVLFEARKHLRTDQLTSSGAGISTAVVERLLRDGLADLPEIGMRNLTPVMQWLLPKATTDRLGEQSVQLRGEALHVSVLDMDPNLAATTVLHMTYSEEWRLCGSGLCRTPLAEAVRSGIGYELSVPLDSTAPGDAKTSPLLLATGLSSAFGSQTYPADDASTVIGHACDPLPSTTSLVAGEKRLAFRHAADGIDGLRTNRVLCAFFAIAGATSRFTYLVGSTAATLPPNATSGTLHNPIDFTLSE